MADLRITTSGGQRAGLNRAIVEEFRGRLRGELLLQFDDGYDEARSSALLASGAVVADQPA